MPQKPHILVTNDDGISAPGIKQLWKSLLPYASLTVVAPFGEQSSVGLSSTLRQPLVVHKIDWVDATGEEVWSVTGTPSDCIKMALEVILKERPTLVVSGINRGANSGRNVLYSGTVAAAIESVLQDIPAVAFSCLDYHDPDYEEASKHVPAVVNFIMKHPLPSGTLLNVNFPKKSQGKIQGFKLTSQGKEYWTADPDKRIHPSEGLPYYWLGSKLKTYEEHEDSDIAWLNRGYMAAVPIHIADLTDRIHLKNFKEQFELSFKPNLSSKC